MSFKLVYMCLPLVFSVLNIEALTRDFYWRDYTPGEIPYDAIEGAPGRYIGQVYHTKGNLVATILSHTNTAIIEIYGREYARHNIKILCSPYPGRFYWEEVDFTQPDNQQMKDAIKGGYEVGVDLDLFIGKALHESEWKIGKVMERGTAPQGLWLWHANGEAINLKQFHLLKYNSSVVNSEFDIRSQ